MGQMCVALRHELEVACAADSAAGSAATTAGACWPPMSQQRPTSSHLIPRTRDGWIATISFVALFMLAMPPVTHTVLNRVEPWIGGFPFLYAALLAIYVGLIGILVWALRRGV